MNETNENENIFDDMLNNTKEVIEGIVEETEKTAQEVNEFIESKIIDQSNLEVALIELALQCQGKENMVNRFGEEIFEYSFSALTEYLSQSEEVFLEAQDVYSSVMDGLGESFRDYSQDLSSVFTQVAQTKNWRLTI